MSRVYGYGSGRRREISHQAAGTMSTAIGYAIARPPMALPSNCGESGKRTA